jgi:hypothetical protein
MEAAIEVAENDQARRHRCIMLQQVRSTSDLHRLKGWTWDDRSLAHQVVANTKSLCLYARLGFRPIETCLCLTGYVNESLTLYQGTSHVEGSIGTANRRL